MKSRIGFVARFLVPSNKNPPLPKRRNSAPVLIQSYNYASNTNLNDRIVRKFFSMLGSSSFNLNRIPLKDSVVEQLQNALPNKKNFTVTVEGNIGSGKTTLVEYFKRNQNVQAVSEPLDQWTNIHGHNALELLYTEPTRWTFTFEMYAMLSRVQVHSQPQTKPVKMMERSLHSTRHCFVENDLRNKTINGMEYAVLSQWYDWLVGAQKGTTDLIVYVRADPEKCFQRLRQRSRKEEAGVPFTLLEQLHNLHEDWLVKQTLGQPPAPVLILDANCDLESLPQLYESHKPEILFGNS